MDNQKITFEQLNDPAFRRAELIKEKSGAVYVAFKELDGLINKTRLAERYFQRTHAWLSQKIHGCTVLNRQKTFTQEEYKTLAEAFRDIARNLDKLADEIDAAEMD